MVVYSLLPVCLLLVLGEVGLRVWAYHFRTPYERYNYRTGRLELVPNTHIPGPGGSAIHINSRGFVGPEFSVPKPEGTYRVIALGDSCTFGTGDPRNAYPHMLERLVTPPKGWERIEVINAGIEGYNSEFALARLRDELLGYDPDMIIIYIGWNDLMKVNPENFSAEGKLSWIAALLQRSYLAKAYNKLLFYYVRPMVLTPRLDLDEVEAHAYDHFSPPGFQSNIRSMVQILRKHQVTPLLVTLPTVLRFGLTDADLHRLDVFFPYYAGSYSVGKLLSLHRAYNDTIRSLAASHGITLVDLDTVFNRHKKDDLFWDTMHPNLQGQRLIAESLAEVVGGRSVTGSRHTDGKPNGPMPQVGPRSRASVE
jgi:lysophospholipase L1-like esterase